MINFLNFFKSKENNQQVELNDVNINKKENIDNSKMNQVIQNEKYNDNEEVNFIENDFKKISDYVIPFACLLAPDVGITKNGEVFQIIKIELNDFKYNQENELRATIRNVLLEEKIIDLKTAIWIQTVKIIKENEQNNKKNEKENDICFVNYLNKDYKKKEKKLNNYSTILYISVFRQHISLDINLIKLLQNPKNILNFLSHNIYIDNQIETLRDITSKIINFTSKYNSRLLSTFEKEGVTYSEIINFLSFLVNFENKQYQTPEIDISKIINYSKFIFGNGIIGVLNKENNTKLLNVFSLKEVPIISTSVVSDLFTISSEIIITEFVSFIDKEQAKNSFKEQVELLKTSENSKQFASNAGLDFIMNDDNENNYAKSSIQVIFISNDKDEMNNCLSFTTSMFQKYGIVAVREDISTERAFYAMLPGNFTFVHRFSIHDAKETGVFSYSYTPKEQSKGIFLNEKSLFKIGTLRNSPFEFGILKDKKSILISGPEDNVSIFTNFIVTKFLATEKCNIFSIDLNTKSKTFYEAIEGNYYQVSLKKQHNNVFFNPLENFFYKEQDMDLKKQKEIERERFQYIIEFFFLLLANSNVIITPEISASVNEIVGKIIYDFADNKNLSLSDIKNILKKSNFDSEIQTWYSIGKCSYLFDNKVDILDKENNIAFYLDETIIANTHILSCIINHLISKIIYKKKDNNYKTFLVLNSPFVLLRSPFFKSKLDKLMQKLEQNDVILILKIIDIDSYNKTIVDFRGLIDNCGTQIHFGNKKIDNDYLSIFRLQKPEYLAIKTLGSYPNSLLIKQQDRINSCLFDLSQFDKSCQILSELQETRARVLAIKEELQTNDPDRWIPAFYNEFELNRRTSQEMVELEIRALEMARKIVDGN